MSANHKGSRTQKMRRSRGLIYKRFSPVPQCVPQAVVGANHLPPKLWCQFPLGAGVIGALPSAGAAGGTAGLSAAGGVTGAPLAGGG